MTPGLIKTLEAKLSGSAAVEMALVNAILDEAKVPQAAANSDRVRFLVEKYRGSEEHVRVLLRDLDDARRREAPRWPWPFSWVLG